MTDAIGDLWLLVERSRSLWKWLILALAFSSVGDLLWNLGPPFPMRWLVVLITAAVEVAVYVVGYNTFRNDSESYVHGRLVGAWSWAVILAIGYFVAAGLLVMQVNNLWNTDARGLAYTQLAKQYKQAHPDKVDWEMVYQHDSDVKAIFVPWTVDVTRTLLLALWLWMYTAIAFALALFAIGEVRRVRVLPF